MMNSKILLEKKLLHNKMIEINPSKQSVDNGGNDILMGSIVSVFQKSTSFYFGSTNSLLLKLIEQAWVLK